MSGPGRPSAYTPELATEICRRLALGESLRAICRDDHMPDESTVRGWAMDNVEHFFPQYTRAREIGYHGMFDGLLEIADDGSNDSYRDDEGGVRVDHDVIARSRLRVDTRKWMLSKALPKVYGERVDIEQKHTLEISDTTPLELGRGIAFLLNLAQREAGKEPPAPAGLH